MRIEAPPPGGPWPPVVPADRGPARERAVAREFAQVLLERVVAGLRRTVGEAEPSSQAMTLWREMLDAALARALASSDGLGLAQLVERALRQTGPAERAAAADQRVVRAGQRPAGGR